MPQSHYHFSDPNSYSDIDDMIYDNMIYDIYNMIYDNMIDDMILIYDMIYDNTAYVCILVTTK